MTTTRTELEIKVDLVNRVHAAANEYQARLLDHVVKYVGSKIIKADGSLLKSVKTDLDSVPVPDGVQVWFDPGYSSLFARVKGCDSSGRFAQYHEASVFVGSHRDGVLYDLNHHRDELPTGFTVEKVQETRQRVAKLSAQVRSLERQLAYFGNRY